MTKLLCIQSILSIACRVDDCSLVANLLKTLFFSPSLISHYLQLDRAGQLQKTSHVNNLGQTFQYNNPQNNFGNLIRGLSTSATSFQLFAEIRDPGVFSSLPNYFEI